MIDPALYWTILQAEGAAVLGLDLPGIGNRVYGQLLPAESGYNFASKQVQDVVYPAVLLTCEGEVEQLQDGDSEGLMGVFPSRCWVADKTEPGMAGRLPIYLAARCSLFGLFHQRKLAGAPMVLSIDVTPEVVFDPRLPQYQHIVSGMVLRAQWGQPRY